MSELQIRAASLSSRCEICHQTDCFDAEQNYCSRCVGVISNQPVDTDEIRNSLRKINKELNQTLAAIHRNRTNSIFKLDKLIASFGETILENRKWSLLLLSVIFLISFTLFIGSYLFARAAH